MTAQPAEKHLRVTSEVMLITPDLAAEMLSHNVTNRNLNRQDVIRLSLAMQRGEWKLNGQSISFDSNGNLQDGQHRLTAVIRSGVSVPMLVVTGVQPEARTTVDTGRKRSIADEMKMRGEKNSNNAASILSMMNAMSSDSAGGNLRLTTDQALEMLETTPHIREAALKADTLRHNLPVPVSALGYCIQQFMTISVPDNDRFWDKIMNGDFAGPTDPCFVLQRHLNKLAASRHFTRGAWPNKVFMMALIIKAWNAFRKGNTIQVLRWKPTEEFPKPR